MMTPSKKIIYHEAIKTSDVPKSMIDHIFNDDDLYLRLVEEMLAEFLEENLCGFKGGDE